MKIEQLKEMLTLQDTFNKKVNPAWADAGFKWNDAIMVEGVELLEHYGWKWWKKQTPDMEQCQMELIDIWHFIMSDFMETNHLGYREEDYVERTAVTLLDYLQTVKPDHAITDTDVKGRIRNLIGSATSEDICVVTFFALCNDFGIDDSKLFEMYVGKNALNHFRQTHGYKDGSYIKEWNGEEDNVHLMRVIEKSKEGKLEGSLFDYILNSLENIYKTVK